MKKNTRSKRKTNKAEKPTKHVLAKLRGILDIDQKDTQGFKDTFGVALDTVKSIQSGRLPLSAKVAQKISDSTGVSVGWIMAGDSNVAPFTNDEKFKPFTKETCDEHRMNLVSRREPTFISSRGQGDETFRLWILLCIKCGELMQVARESGQYKLAAWQLRDEIGRIGRQFPNYEVKPDSGGVIKTTTSPQKFSLELQMLMNSGRVKSTKLWRTILDRMHADLEVIERAEAKRAVAKLSV